MPAVHFLFNNAASLFLPFTSYGNGCYLRVSVTDPSRTGVKSPETVYQTSHDFKWSHVLNSSFNLSLVCLNISPPFLPPSLHDSSHLGIMCAHGPRAAFWTPGVAFAGVGKCVVFHFVIPGLDVIGRGAVSVEQTHTQMNTQ